MQFTVDLPNDLDRYPNPGREALEALAIAGYRSGKLSAFQAARVLGFTSRFEFDVFLKGRKILDHAYDAEELAEDLDSLQKLNREKTGKDR